MNRQRRRQIRAAVEAELRQPIAFWMVLVELPNGRGFVELDGDALDRGMTRNALRACWVRRVDDLEEQREAHE